MLQQSKQCVHKIKIIYIYIYGMLRLITELNGKRKTIDVAFQEIKNHFILYVFSWELYWKQYLLIIIS